MPLHTLSDESLDELLDQVVVETVGKGQMLFRQGDTDHQHVYLIAGRVALLTDKSVVDRVEAGTETARFPLAHQLPRNHSARAETKVRITRIDSRLLSDMLARSQTVDYQVADFEEAGDDDWMSLLLQSRVLQQVPASNIQRVMMSIEQVEVAKGEDLVRQGDPGDFYYMLTSGRAVVRRDSGDGNGAAELATLGPGDAFGEEALLSDNPRNSTVTMLNDGMVLRLSKENFLQLIQNPLLEQIDPVAAKAKVADGAVWLDLRSSGEFDASHFEGAINFPFESLRYQAGSLSPDRHYVVYSSTAARAMAGAFLLTGRGFHISVLADNYAEDAAASSPANDATRPGVAKVADILEGTVDEAAQARLHDAEARTRELEDQLKKAQQREQDAVAERDQHLGQVQQAIEQAKRKLIETEEQKLEALAAQEKAYGEMEALTGSLEKLQTERTSLVERMSEIEGLDKRLQERLAKAERELIRERERAESAAHSLEEFTSRLNEEVERREEDRRQHALERGELKEELTALRMDLELANAELEEMRGELAEQYDRDASIEKLRRQLDEANATRDSLAHERTAIQHEAEQRQADEAEVRRQVDDLAAQLAGQTQKSEQAEAELQQARTEQDALQQEIVRLNAQLDTAQGAEHARGEVERQAAEAAAAAQQQIERLRAELETANDQVSKQAGSAQDLQEQLNRLQDDHRALQDQLTTGDREAGAALQQAQVRFAELEGRLASERDDADRRIAESAEALAEVQRALAESESERERLTALADEASAERELGVQRQADEAAREREEAEQALRTLRDELDALRSTHEQAQTDLSESRDAAEQAATRIGEIQRELEDARDAASAAQTRAATAEEALARAEQQRVDMASERDQADQQLQSLQTELAAAEQRAGELAASAEEFERQLAQRPEDTGADTTAELAALRTEYDGLVRRHEDRGMALDGAHQEQAELIEALNAASAERESLQLALSDREDEQARLVDLENQVAQALQEQQRELLAHEQEQRHLREQLDAAADRRRALEEEVGRLTELLEQDNADAEPGLRAEHDALKAELAQREREVGQLRGVLEEYVEQIKGGGADSDVSEIDALRTELEMVREQAIRDVAQMREQLAAAETQKRRLQQADGREAISHEAMRQKIDALETSLSERQRDLGQAEESNHMLEDELEDANRKLDELQREVDKAQAEVEEAMLTRREAENAREQLQDALEELRAGDGADSLDLRDSRLQGGGNGVISIDSVAPSRRWLGIAVGAGLALAGLEGISFVTSGGELFTLLMSLSGR